MCSKEQLERIIKTMVDCYRSVYGNSVEDIVLYGSYARGDYSADSDIDIAAVVHGERTELQEKLKCVWDISAEIGLENDTVISPVVIPYDEYMKYKQTLPYYKNIAEEGRRIG